MYYEGGYQLNPGSQVTDFHTIDNAQHYSGSSRGAMQVDKSNYSLSPNHTKAPSNNSGFVLKFYHILL